MIPFRPEAACPLDGVMVLDLSRLVAGNMLSLQLADFGAEVVKVEHPVATPGALRRPAPKLGEHSAEILARLGIGQAEFAALSSEGIC